MLASVRAIIRTDRDSGVTCVITHLTVTTCRRKGKTKTDKVKQKSETLEDSRSDKEAEHSFEFEISNYAGESATKKPNALLSCLYLF